MSYLFLIFDGQRKKYPVICNDKTACRPFFIGIIVMGSNPIRVPNH
jgi:hypothetical protein